MAKGKQIEWCPEKAEIIYIEQSSQVGKEMTDRFPILVSSPKVFNACTGIVIGFPMTQDERNQDNPFAVTVQGPNREIGYVLAFQPKSFYWRDRQGSPHPWGGNHETVLATALAKLDAICGISTP